MYFNQCFYVNTSYISGSLFLYKYLFSSGSMPLSDAAIVSQILSDFVTCLTKRYIGIVDYVGYVINY